MQFFKKNFIYLYILERKGVHVGWRGRKKRGTSRLCPKHGNPLRAQYQDLEFMT